MVRCPLILDEAFFFKRWGWWICVCVWVWVRWGAGVMFRAGRFQEDICNKRGYVQFSLWCIILSFWINLITRGLTETLGTKKLFLQRFRVLECMINVKNITTKRRHFYRCVSVTDYSSFNSRLKLHCNLNYYNWQFRLIPLCRICATQLIKRADSECQQL